MYKLYERECLPNEGRDEAIRMIADSLSDKGFIVFLTFTGSRAYGWGGTHYDMDIHGIFASYGPYWDDVHIGRKGYDLSVYNLEPHFLHNMDKRWPVFEDFSNPIMVHDGFNFEEYMSFCTGAHLSRQLYTIEQEVVKARSTQQVRKTLHCYRQLMDAIHWLETGEMEINVLKLNEKFGLEQLPELCDMYRVAKIIKVHWGCVFRELDYLEVRLAEALELNTTEVDKDAMREWQMKTIHKLEELDGNDIWHPNF